MNIMKHYLTERQNVKYEEYIGATTNVKEITPLIESVFAKYGIQNPDYDAKITVDPVNGNMWLVLVVYETYSNWLTRKYQKVFSIEEQIAKLTHEAEIIKQQLTDSGELV